MLENYDKFTQGYDPFLIRKGWQVAKLTYLEEQSIGNINKIDQHQYTDEVFILLAGRAILITAKEKQGTWDYLCTKMQPYVIYNVPAGVWHNIALFYDSDIVIIEADNTHLHDAIYQSLSTQEAQRLNEVIAQFYKDNFK